MWPNAKRRLPGPNSQQQLDSPKDKSPEAFNIFAPANLKQGKSTSNSALLALSLIHTSPYQPQSGCPLTADKALVGVQGEFRFNIGE